MAISNRVSSEGTVMDKSIRLWLVSRVIFSVGVLTVLSKRYRSLYRNIRTFHLKHQNLLMKTSVSFGWGLYTYIYAYRSLHPLHASSSHTTRLSRRERNIPGGRRPFATTIPNFGYIHTDVYKFNAYWAVCIVMHLNNINLLKTPWFGFKSFMYISGRLGFERILAIFSKPRLE